MMKTKPTIKEFAKSLGISTATVSRAFNDSGRISLKTREKIIAQAQRLGYRANVHARNLGGKRSTTIALFYPAFNNEEPDYFITEIMQGINNSLRTFGYNLQISPFPFAFPESAAAACQGQILEGSFAGVIIVAGSRGSIQLLETAARYGIPHVIVGHMPDQNCNAVLFDNEYGAMLAGKYFKNTGRQHPAYISGYLDRRKKAGFRKGLQFDDERIVFIEGGNSFRDGGLAFERLSAAHPETDCVLCANDVLAVGFIRAASTQGIRIPEDIAVIGFDDIRLARYMTPALSSVSLHLTAIGEQAVNVLKRLLDGEKEIQPQTIECDLVLRESS
ncbi:MAG: LacI family DNA-binding transcriptional regulator [Victivallales bacterium]|nr:LacI family DNA-binding transcriptional regulator [Victivallales bacterium]